MAASDISFHLEQIRKRKWDDQSLARQALPLAAELQKSALRQLNSSERVLLAALSRLATEKRNRRFVRSLCSLVFFSSDLQSRSEQLRKLIAEFNGIPNLFSTMGKIRLKGAAIAPRSLQAAAMSEVRRVFQATFGELTLPPELDKASKRIRELNKAGIRSVVAPLAPDTFGNAGAEKYQRNLEGILSKQQEAGIVIDPLRLCPLLSAYSPEQGAAKLKEKLLHLLKAAGGSPSGRRLLLEAGRSDVMAIVIDAFCRVYEELPKMPAELVIELPAYLSSSQTALRDLINWASARCAKGKPPLPVAIIKGSHLMEEQQLNHLYGQRAPLSRNKLETDRRFKRLLRVAMVESKGAIVPMIGTHSCFDLAYGLLLWASSGKKGMPGILLTAGLGNHQARLLAKQGADVTLRSFATATGAEAEFEHYLITLLNELALPDGFLSAGYAVETDSMEWNKMRQHFLASIDRASDSQTGRHESATFESTGLARMLERSHIDALYHEANKAREMQPDTLQINIAGEPYTSNLTYVHRSLTVPGLVEYRFSVADYKGLRRVLNRAAEAARGEPLPAEQRAKTLLRLARMLEDACEELAGLMVKDAGYTLSQADAELRNAADACRLYARAITQDGFPDGTRPAPLGLVVVAPSPNRPVEEAVSAIAAAWVTGNVIIYKPAMASMMLGLRLCDLMRKVGMNDPALQLVPCLDNEMAHCLMSDPRVSAVIAALSPRSRRRLLEANPACHLIEADLGQCVAYLDAQCDWRQAVRDLSRAALRRSGRCVSCPHVVLVHAALCDNQHFIAALHDLVTSLTAEPGWVEGCDLGPMAAAPSEEALELLSGVEGDGEWLVQPYLATVGTQIRTPGVRINIRRDGLYARNCRNLPIIALMKVADAEEAIELQNKLSGGQMAIVYTLSNEVRKLWRKKIRVGNQGINCCPEPQPGLIPFGGWREACNGFTPKAGSVNYLTALCRWDETGRPQRRGKQRDVPFAPWEQLQPKPDPEDFTRLTAAADSISYWWTQEFSTRHLLDSKPGETTELSYKACPVCLRADDACSDADLGIALMAALRLGCDIELSCESMRPWMLRELTPLKVSVTEESRSDYLQRFSDFAKRGVRVRDCFATAETIAAAKDCGLRLDTARVVANGRIEMLHYLRELVVTRRTARYGNLLDDADTN